MGTLTHFLWAILNGYLDKLPEAKPITIVSILGMIDDMFHDMAVSLNGGYPKMNG